MAAEDRLARESDGRGWARDTVERLCVDRAGKLLETCDRDGTPEDYLAPRDHRIGVALAGYGIMSIAAGEAHLLNLCVGEEYRSRGIGRAISVALARDGAAVAVNYRSAAPAAEQLAAELTAATYTARAFGAALESNEQIEDMVAAVNSDGKVTVAGHGEAASWPVATCHSRIEPSP